MTKPHILYVEDEVFMARIVSDTLKDKGYEVTMLHDGGDVVRHFIQHKPDVCLLDVMLPNKDGFTLADEIREIDHNVPIIFLTAKSEVRDVVAGFKIGGNDYVRKPFSMEELLVRIENVLRGKHQPQVSQEEVQLGKLAFNIRRQTLSSEEEERKLSYRESELLRLLVEQENNIVERRDILILLWGSDSFFNSRTLDVYITKLRGYLRADPTLEIITIKGIGYRFVKG
ncbi:DNA-binding response regulator, OmpR family, contains REC and winged-helix (wHTH) domain [Cnuella takakiae]|uniref:DNA-binding response regulator, OmpR family, contains REC and winged-helix (WHTH) domain n=1 Tax=Cnuella takakiae TaxID=1302690 RepID=A0A1M5F965_9BACT|nr:response regulator transcription factor [Cnuella takakiae]OLY91021.1 DNA-binding response regulator [Cnuella takakiae]SHF88057.1 DNA-binding response regulator, OmpR family, contains REC and winged-helix (wHTH) domain [Cnuella takakiae]